MTPDLCFVQGGKRIKERANIVEEMNQKEMRYVLVSGVWSSRDAIHDFLTRHLCSISNETVVLGYFRFGEVRASTRVLP